MGDLVESGGYEAEPSDVEALVADLTTDPTLDTLDRYHLATRDQVLYQAAVTRLGEIRSVALAALHGGGLSYSRIADLVGISRSKVQQLVERGR